MAIGFAGVPPDQAEAFRVRPDGYIGAFVGSEQTDTLTHFLAEQGLV
ncbi:hypothetical protein NLM31_11180 [Bradyrhizobium sp. CCGUVB4N]|nr:MULTISPECIES: hypothetical protein [unclassified Bradyrhizobium]MCP3380897.1 hypothetical protein [Bradyrhizobium sp. CCGUVB4N]WFU79609.1 hypothetical protein QA645_34745 [Bradyrhizobium sp. CIAT3101]